MLTRSHGIAHRLALAIQDDTDVAMCATAARLADEDRAKWPKGGVLLVANSQRHASRLVAMLTSAHGVAAATVDRILDPRVAVVVVTKNNARGYNGAIRLGAIVRGV